MKSVKLPHYLYTGSLFFLIFLTALCVAISAADVIIQALTDKTNTGTFDYRNLIVVGGSYVILALAALLFSCSRMLTVRASLQDIPKLYIPIKQEDLPKKVYFKIHQEFEQAKQTRKLAEPRPEDIQAVGWAKPGTPLFDGLDFKQAIARTPAIVEKVAISINPDYARPLYVPIRQYMEFLMQQGLIDKQLGLFYLEGYEIARFSHDPLSQEHYMDIMKHLAAILQNMGYNLKNGNNNNNKHHKPESIISLGHNSDLNKSSRRSRRRLSSHCYDDEDSILTWNSRSTPSKKHPSTAKLSHFEI
ncbi:hypothetical protein INT48_004049 [Thamnidium elegans]|uniref:Defect at low temperature protein 1 n=1 Tax=Thamnidium elegans TaxID=101142 RepID=A0A8H7VST2_9FUNG|nr:hypothetical protein INT48_004049 [Thamnidium elegans]